MFSCFNLHKFHGNIDIINYSVTGEAKKENATKISYRNVPVLCST